MLRNAKNLRGFGIRATDGVIGTVDDFYFDDQDWTIRYFVVNTGSWLTGRKVLVPPDAISSPAWTTHVLPASLSKAEVERSPDMDTRKPVSRQSEIQEAAEPDDYHLRSCNAVIGHHIEASDGDIGHVDDIVLDDHTWAIRYLIVDTSNWIFPHENDARQIRRYE